MSSQGVRVSGSLATLTRRTVKVYGLLARRRCRHIAAVLAAVTSHQGRLDRHAYELGLPFVPVGLPFAPVAAERSNTRGPAL